MHSDDLVLGLDIGGTSSRALVADLAGRVLGTGRAGGGNPNSHPPEHAVEQISTAVREALAPVAADQVRLGVLGMAGSSKMTDPAMGALFEGSWERLGLTCPMRVLSDAEVAFAAGTPAPSGTVLIAGTGAVAARIDQHRLVATSGGYGWLLGDEGSSFWLGREAVREALRTLDHRGHRGELVSSVLAELLRGEQQTGAQQPANVLRDRLITAVNAAPPIQLAALAPLVTAAALGGDKNALDIVRRAAGLLADTAQATRTPGDAAPVVLAGGLVGAGNPLGDALRTELASRTPAEVHLAGPGAGGAAWLAAAELRGTADPELHAHYLRSA